MLHPHHFGVGVDLHHLLTDPGSEGDGDVSPDRGLEVGIEEDAVRTEIADNTVVLAVPGHADMGGAMDQLAAAPAIGVEFRAGDHGRRNLLLSLFGATEVPQRNIAFSVT